MGKQIASRKENLGKIPELESPLFAPLELAFLGILSNKKSRSFAHQFFPIFSQKLQVSFLLAERFLHALLLTLKAVKFSRILKFRQKLNIKIMP